MKGALLLEGRLLKRSAPPARPLSTFSAEGFFLLGPDPSDGFTPEDFTPEHRLLREMARSFFEREVAPKGARLDSLDEETLRDLLLRAGELGLFGAGIPERDGGSGRLRTSMFRSARRRRTKLV